MKLPFAEVASVAAAADFSTAHRPVLLKDVTVTATECSMATMIRAASRKILPGSLQIYEVMPSLFLL